MISFDKYLALMNSKRQWLKSIETRYSVNLDQHTSKVLATCCIYRLRLLDPWLWTHLCKVPTIQEFSFVSHAMPCYTFPEYFVDDDDVYRVYSKIYGSIKLAENHRESHRMHKLWQSGTGKSSFLFLIFYHSLCPSIHYVRVSSILLVFLYLLEQKYEKFV